MPMYNLIEYSKIYSKTTGSLWNYYRDKPNSDTEIIPLEFQSLLIIKQALQEGNNTEKEVEIVVPLKHLKQLLENTRYTVN